MPSSLTSRFSVIGILGVLFACRPTLPPNTIPVSPGNLVTDTTALSAFADSIGKGAFGYIDGILVIREGRSVFQRVFSRTYDSVYPMTEPPGPFNYHDSNWHPFYQGTSLHTLQSVTKSVTSILFGIALDRGDLSSIDQRVEPFFTDQSRFFSDPRKRQITIRHLLTMTSGIRWPEGGTYDNAEDLTGRMEKSRDWISLVLEQPMEAAPGEVWSYSSGSAALLAAVFQAATRRDIQDYATEHLFTPLGIKHFLWKRSAGDLTDTEGGLYLEISDLAKLGQLYLDRGVWQGRRVVSAKWVEESVVTQPRRALDRRDKKYGYGRLWWTPPSNVVRDTSAFFAWGYGGQYLIVLPTKQTVAVMTAWNLDQRRILPEDFASRVEKAVSMGR